MPDRGRLYQQTEVELLTYLGSPPLAEARFGSDISWVITGVFNNTHNEVFNSRPGPW